MAKTPSAPNNVISVASVNSNYVLLQWSCPACNQATFIVERSTNGVSFSVIATPGGGVRYYTDSQVLQNTLYYYRIKAVNKFGSSPYSDVVSVTTNSTTPPPSTDDPLTDNLGVGLTDNLSVSLTN